MSSAQRFPVLAVALLLSPALAGRGTAAAEPPRPLSGPAELSAEAAREQPRVVELIYWSTRQREHRGASFRFGPELAGAHGGTMRISVPPRHRRAHCERPGVLQSADPNKHIVISRVAPRAGEMFPEILKNRAQGAGRRDLLIFVHGFKNTFALSGWRAGQLAVDLEFPGTVVLFSWPSNGTLGADEYFADRLSVGASVPQFAQLLQTIRRTVPKARLHILAHSMGCDLTCTALAHLAATTDGPPIVEELVLAAPDIDAAAFRRVLAPHLPKAARRVTLYVSREDQVLNLSRLQNADRPRLGDANPGIPDLPAMQTVDVSGTINDGETLVTGHRYYAANSTVIRDIGQVLRGRPPGERGLSQQPAGGGRARYWTFPRPEAP